MSDEKALSSVNAFMVASLIKGDMMKRKGFRQIWDEIDAEEDDDLSHEILEAWALILDNAYPPPKNYKAPE